MTATALPASLVEAYRATDYCVTLPEGRFVLRIGEKSADLARLFEATGHSRAVFITSENPFSESVCQGENAANIAALRLDLEEEGAIVFEGFGQGRDGDWPAEASFLAVGLLREKAVELGKKFRQNAVVYMGADTVPELFLLR